MGPRPIPAGLAVDGHGPAYRLFGAGERVAGLDDVEVGACAAELVVAQTEERAKVDVLAGVQGGAPQLGAGGQGQHAVVLQRKKPARRCVARAGVGSSGRAAAGVFVGFGWRALRERARWGTKRVLWCDRVSRPARYPAWEGAVAPPRSATTASAWRSGRVRARRLVRSIVGRSVGLVGVELVSRGVRVVSGTLERVRVVGRRAGARG